MTYFASKSFANTDGLGILQALDCIDGSYKTDSSGFSRNAVSLDDFRLPEERPQPVCPKRGEKTYEMVAKDAKHQKKFGHFDPRAYKEMGSPVRQKRNPFANITYPAQDSSCSDPFGIGSLREEYESYTAIDSNISEGKVTFNISEDIHTTVNVGRKIIKLAPSFDLPHHAQSTPVKKPPSPSFHTAKDSTQFATALESTHKSEAGSFQYAQGPKRQRAPAAQITYDVEPADNSACAGATKSLSATSQNPALQELMDYNDNLSVEEKKKLEEQVKSFQEKRRKCLSI